jgi:hypothetical protein
MHKLSGITELGTGVARPRARGDGRDDLMLSLRCIVDYSYRNHALRDS